MEPENIDWNSVESIFVEDDTYENFDAPRWVDLSAPDEPIDDQAWFCNPGQTHLLHVRFPRKPKGKRKLWILPLFFFGLIFAFGVSDCRHRKNAEDFFKPIAYLKVCKFCKLFM